MSKTVSVTLKLPEPLVDWLDMATRLLGYSREGILAHIFSEYCNTEEGLVFAPIVATLSALQKNEPRRARRLVDEILAAISEED